MRRLCLGGTFNPIHHGHLIASRAVAERGGFDAVTLIPSGQPPLKTATAGMAAANDRLTMCELAITGVPPYYEVNPLELARPGASYTIDTVRQLRSLGWPSVHWLIGADTLPQLAKWHDYEQLLAEVEFVVMSRPGSEPDWHSLPKPVQALRANMVESPQIEISATDIRRRVAAGLPIDFLTPPAVCQYIQNQQLYRQ